MEKRNRYTAESKANVVLELLWIVTAGSIGNNPEGIVGKGTKINASGRN
jgi:hypothetical protein